MPVFGAYPTWNSGAIIFLAGWFFFPALASISISKLQLEDILPASLLLDKDTGAKCPWGSGGCLPNISSSLSDCRAPGI